jgi:hypothetical protein
MEHPDAHQQEGFHACALRNGLHLYIIRQCTSGSSGYQCVQACIRWPDTRSHVARYLGYG